MPSAAYAAERLEQAVAERQATGLAASVAAVSA
jgi:hypothetical protein